MNEPLIITREDAIQRGRAPVTIRMDAGAAGLVGRVFAEAGEYLALSGPPGGAVIVQISDGSHEPDVESAARSRRGSIEMIRRDHGIILGEDRDGIVFSTGNGFGRIGWFAVLLVRAEGNVLIACGVSARGSNPVLARDVLEHPSIARALAVLELV